MKIEKISIKGLKSFGNNPQTIELSTDNGTLNLLQGPNGAGKSSIIDAFDYVFYNKVKGKSKKVVKLSSLPNRINKELLVDVDFNSYGDKLNIKRGQHPKTLSLSINGEEYGRAGNANIDKKIESYLEIDLDTFKSFISMSINDFKNFMSLSNDEKKMLLDKLFNLEMVNELNDILKSLVSENKRELSNLEREIETIRDNTDRINNAIEKVKEKKKENLSQEITLIKEKIQNLQEPYKKLGERIQTGKNKVSEVEKLIGTERDNATTIKSELRRLESDLQLYNNDKCPTCKSNLDSEFHLDIKNEILEKRKKLNEKLENVVEKGKSIAEKLKSAKGKLNSLQNEQREEYSKINSLKTKYDELVRKNANDKNEDIDQFLNTIKELNEKIKKAGDEKSEKEDNQIYYNHLKEVFSENGIKKSIIQNILTPINEYISDNLKTLRMPYEVEIDDTFTANVTSLGDVIDIETLSTGETKKINISILLAYLRLIRTKRNINILFLDEVFSSIDIESINDVISLLRKFATDGKINIFLVHHSLLDSHHFDRIIKVEKEVFTTLTEIT